MKDYENSKPFTLCCNFYNYFFSCQEKKPPGLDLGDTNEANSSYIATLEPKQDKVILIEELTGVQCQNCPKAATAIKSISNANPGRVLAVAMHPPSGKGFTEPIPNKSKYDFRVDVIDEIISFLGGPDGYPCASLNRKTQSNSAIIIRSPLTWLALVEPLFSESTPVNIHLQTSYDAENNTGELITKIAFTEDVSDELFITAYVIEDKIMDYQDDSGDKVMYEHNHVFRKILTSVSGSSLNFADKKAGTVLQKRIPFEAKLEGVNAWNLDNCHIIAFVHKSGIDQSILQAAQVSFK